MVKISIRYCAKMFKVSEPKSFRDATSPAMLMSWALGIGTIQYPGGHPQRALSICWSMMYLTLLTIAVVVVEQKDALNPNRFLALKITYQLVPIIDLICIFTYMCCDQVNSKKLEESFAKLDKVNESLNKIGISTNYSSMYKRQIFHLFGIILFGVTIALYRILCNNTSASLMSFLIVEGYTVMSNSLLNYTFGSYIRYIGKRLQRLNRYLAELCAREGNAYWWSAQDSTIHQHDSRLSLTATRSHVRLRCNSVAEEQRMIRILRNARDMHRDLCDVAKSLNRVFGVRILIAMGRVLFYVTIMLFSIYSMLAVATEVTSDIAFELLAELSYAAAFALQPLFVVSACSLATFEAQVTGDLIHEFIDPTSGIDIREEVHGFSLQLMQDPLEITACGLLTLDSGMIRAMAGAVTTYLIFMNQIPRD